MPDAIETFHKPTVAIGTATTQIYELARAMCAQDDPHRVAKYMKMENQLRKMLDILLEDEKALQLLGR